MRSRTVRSRTGWTVDWLRVAPWIRLRSPAARMRCVPGSALPMNADRSEMMRCVEPSENCAHLPAGGRVGLDPARIHRRDDERRRLSRDHARGGDRADAAYGDLVLLRLADRADLPEPLDLRRGRTAAPPSASGRGGDQRGPRTQPSCQRASQCSEGPVSTSCRPRRAAAGWPPAAAPRRRPSLRAAATALGAWRCSSSRG